MLQTKSIRALASPPAILVSRIITRINEGHAAGPNETYLQNSLCIFRPRIVWVSSWKHEHTSGMKLYSFALIKALPERIPVIPA